MAKATLKGIKTNAFARSLALAKVSVFTGARVASHAVGNFFAQEADKPERLKALLVSQMDRLAGELGQLKGSLMKVGQLLSMYGEHFLPAEATQFLKTLQSQSPPLEWKAIHKVLRRELSAERLAELEISHTPLASASLGQVHLATRKADGLRLAIKVQYPGVDQAIEGDLKSLRSILILSKLIPTGGQTDQIFEEVQSMLRQEVDYSQELKRTQYFKHVLAGDPRFIVPSVFSEYSTQRILTTSFEEGFALDSPEVMGLSQKRRNAIGAAAMDLYLRELFEFQAVQTDPHFGNYRVRISEKLDNIEKEDQLVLLDFGAVRELSAEFVRPYRQMVLGALDRDSQQIIAGAEGVGFLRSSDSEEQKKAFIGFCELITEPFHSDTAYDWGTSDLPKRVMRRATEFALMVKLRLPPKEIIFLDRKLGGMFVFLSGLKVRLKGRARIAKILRS